MTTAQKAMGGVVGPVVFVLAWSVLGAAADNYAPIRNAISDLAADGAATQSAMTAALVVLGAGLVLFGLALRTAVRPLAGTAAVIAGVATVGVAAFPLGSPFRDRVHGHVANLAYAALAATPLLAVRPHVAARHWRPAAFAAVAGLVTLACVVPLRYGSDFGLWQRIGLTATHVWIVATALAIGRQHGRHGRPLPPGPPRLRRHRPGPGRRRAR